MVSKTKKYLITTESHEIFVVRRKGNRTIRGFCSECQTEVGLLTLDDVTTMTGKSMRELFGLIENGSIHSIETATGHLLVCLESLSHLDNSKILEK